ncbi:Alkaline phosphatase synthesis sensor protein PhoR [bacterium HR40]|nr:Alkaline phosphatase synthesis sensor protein PhoR [bacterium HR40]
MAFLAGLTPAGLLAGAGLATALQVALLRRRSRAVRELARWLESMAAGERPARLEGLDRELETVLGGPLLRLYRSLRREVRRREEVHRALVELVEGFADPVFVVDRTLRILALSPPAARQFATAPGQSLLAAVRDPGLLAALEAAFRERRSASLDVSLTSRPPRRFSVRVAPLGLAPEGRGALVALREVTEQMTIERMRSDFVANASHELRTPLAAIAAAVETLRGPAANDAAAREEFLALVADEAARMTRLVDDLLALSRIEQSATRPPSEACDLAAVVRRVLARFEPLARRQGVAIETRIAEELPSTLGDADQLEQLVSNLVDNAIKYGRDGRRVIVELDAVAAAPAGTGPVTGRPALRLSVTDFGPGIPAEHLPRLTERFYRVDKGRSRSLGGTGLGLAIVKHVLRRHQGHLTIDSELGRGSTFTVWLASDGGSRRDRHETVTHSP